MSEKSRWILTFALTYMISRVIYGQIGFDYSPFRDGFEIVKLSTDVGIFAVTYFVVYMAIGRIIKRSSKGA